MTIKLSSLIKMLESVPEDKVVVNALGNLHSFRGHPSHLAIYSCNQSTVKMMLSEFKNAIGKTFNGYKDGAYVMHEDTEVHFAHYGSMDEDPNIFINFVDNLFQ